MFKNILSSGVLSAAEGVANVIDRFVETDEEKRAAEMIKAKLVLQPQLAQIELNKIEASHRSIFVAGWRPFIGWVCGFALLWHFVLYDLLSWISLNTISADVKLPELVGTDALISIVIALLGLGGMRSFEKISGRAK